jgi:hypothetical protein
MILFLRLNVLYVDGLFPPGFSLLRPRLDETGEGLGFIHLRA